MATLEELQERLEELKANLSEKQAELPLVEARLPIAEEELRIAGERYTTFFFELVDANTQLSTAQARRDIVQAKVDESLIDVQEDQSRVETLNAEKLRIEQTIHTLEVFMIPDIEQQIEDATEADS